MTTLYPLPPLPSPRLMAFDESIEIKGYSAEDMKRYASQAVADYVERTRRPLLYRIRAAFRGVDGMTDSTVSSESPNPRTPA